jgi:uncharacterized repeat protein (TIGR03803 family)
MKTDIINLFTRLGGASCAAWVLPALIAGLGLIPAGRVTAQTFTTLHNFTGFDGAGPYADLILSDNVLYGTVSYGGSSGNGTVFEVNTNGTGFTTLYSFTASANNILGVYTNSDGALPYAGVILSGNTLYGTANEGGSSGAGTVFAVNTDRTGFTNLHSFTAVSNFTNSDGAAPHGLILSGNTLYGTAGRGGSLGWGTVFAVNTNGTGFTNLHNFTAGTGGSNPWAGLILSGNTLYGTAINGGSSGNGMVFAVNTNGTGFTNLYSFTATSGSLYTNSDGTTPYAGLILSGSTLYGTANGGGSAGGGTVFKLNTDGTGFTNVHSFRAGGYDASSNYTNNDGVAPLAGLILSGNTLYGTAYQGGSSGYGTVFAVSTSGTGFVSLHNFTATSNSINSDGIFPKAGLILSGNTLYGTAYYGGSSGWGTVFSLSLGSVSAPAPTLTIVPSGTNVILTWPVNAAGFILQSTTNLVSPVVWSTVSPGPVVVNGQYAVTNSTSGTNKFYRLSQ